MNRLERELNQSRALRDAALDLVRADLACLRENWSSKSLGERALERVSHRAEEVLETASETARSKPAALAAILGALALWFARNPIASLFEREEESEEEPNSASADHDAPADTTRGAQP